MPLVYTSINGTSNSNVHAYTIVISVKYNPSYILKLLFKFSFSFLAIISPKVASIPPEKDLTTLLNLVVTIEYTEYTEISVKFPNIVSIATSVFV